jgi:hypothetical protein
MNRNDSNHSDEDETTTATTSNSHGGTTTPTMRRIISNAEISVGADDNDPSKSINRNDYKVRKSSLIGYVCVCV